MRRVAILAMLVAAGTVGAQGAAVFNGSFEEGTNGWAVSSRDANPPAYAILDNQGVTDGALALVLGGLNAAGNAVFAQTVTTVPGARYLLSYDHGAYASAGRAQVLRAEVLVGTTGLVNQAVSAFGPGAPSAAFTARSNAFTAVATETTLRFSDETTLSNSMNCDGVLDHVRLSGAVAPPTMDPPGGLYYLSAEVSLVCPTEGANITYTTDGTPPTAASTPYVGPFTVATSATVQAVAWLDGLADSERISADFTISDLPLVAPPTITPNGGAYHTSVLVTLACPTEDASITYTTDGSDPTGASTAYADPFVLTTNTTVKALAWKVGMTDSPIASAAFAVLPAGSLLNGSFEYGTSGWVVTSRDENPPAAVVSADVGRTDGDHAVAFGPSNAVGNADFSQVIATVSGAVYTVSFDHGAFGVRGKPQVLRVEALDGADVLSSTEVAASGKVDNFDPEAVDFQTQVLTFVAQSAETSLRFSDLTTLVNSFSCDGILDHVRISGAVAMPTLIPGGGAYVAEVEVVLDCPTAGATIVYTTDGSEPTPENTVYVEPITLVSNTTVKALAWRDGLEGSAVTSAVFVVTALPVVATPTISPAGGAFATNVEVSLDCATAGATIVYTLDGTTPTRDSEVYTAPFALVTNATLQAMAWNDGMFDSEVASADFIIFTTIAQPTITPDGGAITGSVWVSLSCETPGAVIHYTSDGSEPGTNAASYLVYTAPFTMGSGTVKAYAARGTDPISMVASATFSNTVADSWAGALPVPGRIEAEHYRSGGEGVAYHDTTPTNRGHAYRSDGVDIQTCLDTGGGYHVGFTVIGEWLEYDIDVAETGAYDFNFRLSAVASPKTISAWIDGVPVVTNTYRHVDGFDIFHDTLVAGVNLTAGPHVLRVYFNASDVAFNHVDIDTRTTLIPIPGRVEAENFRSGGHGVGYFENPNHRTVNMGGAYRFADGVDIELCGDHGGGYNVGNTFLAGEWLAYNIRVARARPHDFTFRVASAVAGAKTLHAELNGLPVATATFDFADGWQAYRDVTIRGVLLPDGDHELKIVFDTESINLNYVEIREKFGMVMVVR